VRKVEKDGVMFAMKEMLKARVMAKKSVESVMKELELMCRIESDFIVNVQYAFHDPEYLYLVMDLMQGGDLRYHHAHIRKFPHDQTQFFIACLVEALEAVHMQGIIHRDVKPENLVFDAYGYLRLTDFGIARVWEPENNSENSGTPGYMAPEVMFKQNHGVAADYFAVGVIGYECIMGRRPYLGRSRKDIREAILQKQMSVSKKDLPPGYPKEAADFVNKCLMR
jgi:serine/threonine protein kinase